MGEKYPEKEDHEKKNVQAKTKTKKTEIPNADRKLSLRKRTFVNYKEVFVDRRAYKNPAKKENLSDDNYNHDRTIINNVNTNAEMKISITEDGKGCDIEDVTVVCDICKIECKTILELKCHMNTNHKRTLFKYPICEVPMNSKVNLKQHYKQNH
jgi:hypothetical protein